MNPAVPEQVFEKIPLDIRHAWGGPVCQARIRSLPEDFQVIEEPLVRPCGEGEHSWVYVQKRNSNTQWVARQLAQFAGVKTAQVSYAGLKDRYAITEQWFSIHLPGQQDPDWQALQHPDFRVLSASRHQRKLKTGALRGNHFVLRVRDAEGDVHRVEERLEQVRAGGFPNYFGSQRFGRDGANLVEAEKMFTSPRKRLPRAKRSIYLSAVRSALFNRVLAERVRQGLWNKLLPGDALQLEGKSACFVAETDDPETAARVAALEVHPTGPLCGDGETLCKAVALDFENRQIAPYGDWVDALRRARVAAARRALRVLPQTFSWTRENDASWILQFFLPAGSYATSLLSEVFQVSEPDE